MNIFVTSESNNKEVVRSAVEKIILTGHSVPYTWYDKGEISNSINLDSLIAIKKCHIHLVIFPIGRGAHIEIGFSLQTGKKTVGISQDTHDKNFRLYKHFASWYNSIDEFVTTLPNLNN